MTPPMDDDRNLLFGVFALQLELIDESKFVDACAVWAMRRETSLAEVLIARGWLSLPDRQEVDKLLERKLKKNGGDVRKTLGVVADAAARTVIRTIDNPAIRKSLSSLPPAAGYVLVETLVRPTLQRSRYHLSRLHSEGGLGKVWLARDSDLNREVALKEIQPSQSVNPEACRRFVREAQVTGQLEHPNIVPVYELSRRPEDDQPFYTMRFIRGQTLRDAIAAFHKGGNAHRDEPLERLRLLQAFVSVCQAVGYAHSRGVIHRDLKPENVVLGGFGEVILLDWGLAKMMDRPDEEDTFPSVVVTSEAKVDATIAGRQLGTPAYMAPEQAEGRLDIVDGRTDIYGLGSILFEILTGQPPHSGKDVTEVLNRIVANETPRVLSLSPKAPAALDAVCAKAMAKSRAQRYLKASDLADDVQRWVANEPVSVYREPLVARVARFARRHQTAVTSVSLLVLTLIPILGFSRFRIAREQALTAKNFSLACNAVNTMLTEVSEVDLADVPQLEEKRKKLLDQARAFYLQVFRDDPGASSAVRLEAGRANGRLGDIAEMLGEFKAAQEAYDQSIQELKNLRESNPNEDSYRIELGRSEFGLAMLLKKANRFREAEAAFRDSLAVWEKLDKDFPDRADIWSALNKTKYQLGATLAKLEGRRSENESLYDAALISQEQLTTKNPEPAELANYARQLHNKAILKAATGQRTEAENLYRQGLGILENLVKDAPSVTGYRYRLASTYNNFGLLIMRSSYHDSESYLRKAQALLAQLANDFPKIPDYQQDLARTNKNLADLIMDSNEETANPGERLREIAGLLTKAVQGQRRLVQTSPSTVNYQANLASTLTSVGNLKYHTDPEGADKDYAEAIQTHAKLVKDYPNVPEYRYALGESLFDLARSRGNREDLEDAREQIDRAIATHRIAWDADPRNKLYPTGLVEDYKLQANILLRLKDDAAASVAAEQLSKVRPDSPEDQLEAAKFLAGCLSILRQGSLPETARASSEQAYSSKAFKLLRAAVGKGTGLESRLLDDPRLDPLREYDEFKKLKEELDRNAKSTVGEYQVKWRSERLVSKSQINLVRI